MSSDSVVEFLRALPDLELTEWQERVVASVHSGKRVSLNASPEWGSPSFAHLDAQLPGVGE